MDNLFSASPSQEINITKYIVIPNEEESAYLLFERISENMDKLCDKYPDTTVNIELGKDDTIMVKTMKLNASVN